MLDAVRQTITPREWDSIAKHRIQAIQEEWDKLPVDDRFWIVFNWLKEYQIFDPTKPKRQLFIPNSYWQDSYKE